MNLHDRLQTYGPTELSTLELLALTLSYKAGPRTLARLARLLQDDRARRLRAAALPELETAGLTRSQAERLVAICELTRRLAVLEADPLPSISAPGDAVAILRPFMEDRDQETFRVLVLNAKNQVVENREIYRGTVDTTVVRIAEILRPAILRNCPALLVAHTHPSGDPQASPADLAMTKQLVRASKLLDLDLVDHLILGRASYTSLKSTLRW